jgi:hypothetical protein
MKKAALTTRSIKLLFGINYINIKMYNLLRYYTLFNASLTLSGVMGSWWSLAPTAS